MSSVTAKCPSCKSSVTIEEARAGEPTTCTSCQATFVPATVISEENQRFQFWMYVGMLGLGAALLIYAAATGQLKPKADAPMPPPAQKAGEST